MKYLRGEIAHQSSGLVNDKKLLLLVLEQNLDALG